MRSLKQQLRDLEAADDAAYQAFEENPGEDTQKAALAAEDALAAFVDAHPDIVAGKGKLEDAPEVPPSVPEEPVLAGKPALGQQVRGAVRSVWQRVRPVLAGRVHAVRQRVGRKAAYAAAAAVLLLGTVVAVSAAASAIDQAAQRQADRLAAEQQAADIQRMEALKPYIAPIAVTPKSVKQAVHPNWPSWLLWLRRANEVEAGLGARILDDEGKPIFHARDGHWEEGAGPDLHKAVR